MAVRVDPLEARIDAAVNLAGEPRDSVHFDGVRPRTIASAAPGVDGDALPRRGALARTAAMAGALERLEEITLEYTAVRRQFGKPVATFQAVQAHLVHGAQQSVIVSVALAGAVRAAESGAARFEIAAAKLLADQAATDATRHAHQAHGAMGMTREYPLHHVTPAVGVAQRIRRRAHDELRPASASSPSAPTSSTRWSAAAARLPTAPPNRHT